jgi:molybdate transport system ATP-binding protein/molybdate/tungstate transport system ATP-binding protein
MVLGPTGAGKTILLETIAGIYPPDKGKVYVDGRDVTGLPPRKRKVSIVYQDYMLFPHLTVEENISFGLRANKASEAEKADQVASLANMLDISHLLHRRPGTLSGGEKQRTAIARALIMKPQVLLLDEPLSALDNETKRGLREELRTIHRITGTTTIHVTHNFEEAYLLGTDMAVMNHGRIVQTGEPERVFQEPNNQFVAGFLGVTNVFEGKSTRQNGLSLVDLGGVEVVSTTPLAGELNVAIRPESILLSLEPLKSSARNSLQGQVKRISDTGTVVRVTVDAGVPIVAAITRSSLDEMHLEKGSTVFVSFKALNVHIFRSNHSDHRKETQSAASLQH